MADSGIKLPTAKGTRGEPAKLMRAMTGIRGCVHARTMNRAFYSIPLQLSVNQHGNESEIQPDLVHRMLRFDESMGDLRWH
jgi:hypothetical protein